MKLSNLLKGFAGVALAALAVASCQPKENTAVTPSLGISASSTQFANGKASVTLTLSEAASSEVKAILEATGTLADKASFEKNPAIAAGSTSLPVEITVPADAEGNLTVSLVAANGATIGTSKSVTLTAKPEKTASVELDYVNFNEEGKGKLTAILSDKLAKDVVVTIGVDDKVSEGATAIAKDNLTFETELTIPAGEEEAELEIAIKDMEALAEGLNEAHFFISAADGAELSKNVDALVSFTVETLVIQRVPYWTVDYRGRYQHSNGNTYSYLYVNPFVKNTYTGDYYSTAINAEYYDVQVIDEETLMNNFVQDGNLLAEDLLKAVQAMDAKYCEEKGIAFSEILYDSAGGLLYSPLEAGNYFAFVIGFTENGKVTGNFGYTYFEVMEATDAYDAWLGTWKIGDAEYSIEPLADNYSYDVVNVAEKWDMLGYFNEEEGSIEFYYEPYAVQSDDIVYFCSGIDNNGYVAQGGDNSSLLAKLSKSGDAYKLEAVSDTFEDGGKTVTTYPTNLGLIGFGLNSKNTVSFLLFSNVTLIDLPAEVTKSEAVAAPARMMARENGKETRNFVPAGSIPASRIINYRIR